jgi:predicted glutamine amidotransferase
MAGGVMDEEITELTKRYYELVNRDHHKDRDCHFSIEKVWSYGQPPYYCIIHNGYINRLENTQKYKTAQDATRMLRDYLKRIVEHAESYDPSDWG